jgi:tRNA A37 threonylcarbamoyladenosine biosynthesis protein TsaE
MVGHILSGGDVVVLAGDLGAGKTLFAKGIGQALDVRQELISPTFNLVLEYPLMPQPLTHSPSTVVPAMAQRAQPQQMPPAPTQKTTDSQAMIAPLPSHQVPHRAMQPLATQQAPPLFTQLTADPPQAQLLRHFDLYRLKDPRELEDIDYFGLIDDAWAISLVEWGDKFPDDLPVSYLQVHIALLTDREMARELSVTAHGPRASGLLLRLATSLHAVDCNERAATHTQLEQAHQTAKGQKSGPCPGYQLPPASAAATHAIPANAKMAPADKTGWARDAEGSYDV